MGNMSADVSSNWLELFAENAAYEPSTYKALDNLDQVPSLSFLKDLIWQEIRTWVRNDTNTMSLISHEDLEGPGRVYLGGMNHALDDKLLEEHGISAVITIHPRDLLAWDERDISYGLRRYGTAGCPVEYHLMVPLEDNSNSNLIDHFDKTNSFIREHLAKGHNMLIHCKSGRSRSVAVLIAYLQHSCYESRIRPKNLAVDRALEEIVRYREAFTEVIRQQRLPVIIILQRFESLLRLYDLLLVGHPAYEATRQVLFPLPIQQEKPMPGADLEKAVHVKGGAAVLKICTAIVFYKNKQKPLRMTIQRLFELNDAYFFELEASEYNGRSYAGSRHAHPGIVQYCVDFANEYGIAIPPAALSLVKL